MNESAYNSIPAGSLAFLDSGEIIAANEAAATTLEFSIEELTTKNIEEVLTLPTRIFYQTHLFPLVRVSGVATEIFITLLSRTGKRIPVLLNARRIENSSGSHNICAFIEVWNRKKFEDELVAARKAAEQAIAENTALLEMKQSLHEHASALETRMQLVKSQNKELSEFNHAITHTFKEPLRKILMFSDMLKDEYNEAHMKKLLNSAAQMKSVLAGMQRFLWLDDKIDEFENAKLSVLVNAAATKLEKELEFRAFNIALENDVDLICDVSQVKILFYELFSNAVKFKKTDVAEITVSSTILNRNAYRNLEHHYRFDAYVRIDVIDGGTGFEEGLKVQLFSLFKKLHSGEGTGIGLAICKKIVERHKGFIEADTRPGEYTKFSIWLPQTNQ